MTSDRNEKKGIRIKKFNKSPVKAAFGMWKGMKENGMDYEDRIRKKWKSQQQP